MRKLRGPGLANEFRTHIEIMRAIAESAEMHLVFNDKSVLSFQATCDGPRMRGKGGPDSWAKKFHDSVREYKFLPSSVVFVFTDETELQLGFGDAAKTRNV
jgi:hypothetical protein